MIEVFEGRIGGGKTLSAMQRCFSTWLRSGLVCTNIDVRWDECKAYARAKYGVELDDRQYMPLDNDDIPRFWEVTPSGTRERPTLVIIDEADVWLDSRETMKQSKTLRNFLKQSRKMSTDIIFITQALKNIDVQIARLVQHVWRFRDMEKWRIPALHLDWPFPQILQAQYDYDGKTQLNKRFWTKDKALYKTYNTDALYDVFKRLENTEAQQVQVKRIAAGQKETPLWVLVALLLALALVVAL